MFPYQLSVISQLGEIQGRPSVRSSEKNVRTLIDIEGSILESLYIPRWSHIGPIFIVSHGQVGQLVANVGLLLA